MSVTNITKTNFNTVESSEKTVLLDFYADWCGPCRILSPIVDEIAEENSDLFVGKINIDKEPELAQTFGIVSIPTLIIMKSGKDVAKMVGVQSKEKILAMLK